MIPKLPTFIQKDKSLVGNIFRTDGKGELTTGGLAKKRGFHHVTPNLTKDFCLQAGLEWKFLRKRTWSEQKLLQCSFLDFTPFVRENRFLSKDSLLPPRITQRKRQMRGVRVES